MLCRILLGRISCMVMDNVVVFEDGPTIRGYKVSELVCSYSYFGGDIVDELEV